MVTGMEWSKYENKYETQATQARDGLLDSGRKSGNCPSPLPFAVAPRSGSPPASWQPVTLTTERREPEKTEDTRDLAISGAPAPAGSLRRRPALARLAIRQSAGAGRGLLWSCRWGTCRSPTSAESGTGAWPTRW